MATLDIFRPSVAAPAHGVFKAATLNVFEQIAAWNNVRMTRNALSKLTTRELEDIGLSRGDIDHIARR